jgi:hypothetical protein
LRICTVYGTHKETTQQKTAQSSLIGTQENEKIRIKKRITVTKPTKLYERKYKNNHRSDQISILKLP